MTVEQISQGISKIMETWRFMGCILAWAAPACVSSYDPNEVQHVDDVSDPNIPADPEIDEDMSPRQGHGTRKILPRLDEMLPPDTIEVLRADIAAGVPIDGWGSLAEAYGVPRRDEAAWNESLMITPDGDVTVVPDPSIVRAGTAPGGGFRTSTTISAEAPAGPSEVGASPRPSPSLPSQVTEGITGSDNRYRTNNQRVVYFDGVASCSGVYVGPRHVLTAGHCLHIPGVGGDVPSHVYPGRNGICDDSSYACTDNELDTPYGAKAVHSGWVPGSWDSTGDSEWDYGIIILQDSASWGQFYNFTGASPPLAPITHWGYPNGPLAACVGSPESDGSAPWDDPYDRACGGFMYGQASNRADQSTKFLYTWHDTQGGHSGGPAYGFVDGNPFIFGTLIGAVTSGSLNTAAAFRRIDSGEASWICGRLSQYPATGWTWHC